MPQIKEQEPDFGDYEFKLKPFNHQAQAIHFIRHLPAAALFAETGTGKTFCALVSTEMRIRDGLIKKALVIAPKSVLINGWYEDCKKFTDLKAIVAHKDKNIPHYCDECGKRYYNREHIEKHQTKTGHEQNMDPSIDWYNFKSTVERIHAPGYDLYMINPESARIHKDALKHAGFDLVILDESTVIKNGSSTTRNAIHEIGWSAKYRIAMTGTPITNSLEDIWGQIQFVDMSMEPTLGQFRGKYFWQHPTMHYIRNPHAWAGEAIVKKIENSCLRIKKSECLDLPDRLHKVMEAEPNSEIKRAYKKFHDDLYLKWKNDEVAADNQLVEMLRLHQIANGFVTRPDGSRVIIAKKPPKIDVLKEILESTKEKVIVWAIYKHDFWAIEHHLKDYNPAVIAGKTANVEAQVKKFKEDDSCRMMLAHPKSAKFGHTWNWAKTTVFYSYGHSLEDYWQARDRNYRIGQENKVTEIFLYSSPIERQVMQALSVGEDFSQGVMGNFGTMMNKVSM